MNTLLIFDGSSILSTHYYGTLPKEVLMAKTLEEKEKEYCKILKTKDGIYTNGVFSMLRSFLKMIDIIQPSHIAICFDVSRNTFRKELYTEYKSNRKETPSPLKEQFILAEQIFEKIGVKTLYDKNFEADDLVGSITRKFEREIPVVILTKDRDYYQLVSSNTTLWLMQSKLEKQEELLAKYHISGYFPEKSVPFDINRVKAETGVYPCQIPDLKGLQGDIADNIHGVKNISSVAPILLSLHNSIEEMYSFIENTNKKEVVEFWKKNEIKRSPFTALTKSEENYDAKKMALLSKQLATIKTDINISYSLSDFVCKINIEELKRICKQYEFHSLLKTL